MASNCKFLLIGLDGFRPDLMSAGLTPNLARFAEAGVRFARHRSAFPSETRVNLMSLATGSYPERHGIVANRFLDPKVLSHQWFDTSRYSHLLSGEARYDGRLVEATSLGEALSDHGRSMAVIATGSEGSTRMKHHKADDLRHFSFSCHYPAISRPDSAMREVIRRLGPPPPYRVPEFATVRYATEVFLSYVWPELEPDLTILWLVEPDTAFHYCGLEDERTREAICAVDAEVGRVLDWWQDHPDVQLIIASDHGHVRQRHKVDLMEHLRRESGLSISDDPADDRDVLLEPGYFGCVTVREGRRDLVEQVVQVLQEAPWCGPILARRGLELDGTLPQDLVLAGHARSPDFYFCLRAEHEPGDGGLPGICWYDGELGEGAGNHGGLHPLEMTSLGLAGGSLFRQRLISDTPSGVVDWAPTILSCLGVPRPASMQGRVLVEAMATGETPAAPSEEVFESARGAYRQRLRRWRVGQHVYIEGGVRLRVDSETMTDAAQGEPVPVFDRAAAAGESAA